MIKRAVFLAFGGFWVLFLVELGTARAARLAADVDPLTAGIQSILDVSHGQTFRVEIVYRKEDVADPSFDRLDLDILAQNPAIQLLPGTSWQQLTLLAPDEAQDFYAGGVAVAPDSLVTTAIDPPPPLMLGGVRLDSVGGPFNTVLDEITSVIGMEFQATNLTDDLILAEVNIVDASQFLAGVAVNTFDNLVVQRGVIRIHPVPEPLGLLSPWLAILLAGLARGRSKIAHGGGSLSYGSRITSAL